MLTLVLLGWPFGALAVVLTQRRVGHDAVPPFALAAVSAFVVAGVLLVMALTSQAEMAVTFLFYGVAAFGGAILSALSAMALARFAQRPPDAHADRRDLD